MGEAFARFLEAADPSRLPLHGGDATTVVVTVPLASLQSELAAADLIGGGLVPGDELTGDRLSAAQARRLACTAKILPVVPAKYGDPKTSGIVAKVAAGKNTIDFELKSK